MWSYLKENAWTVVLVVNYLLAFALAVFILLKNKNPVRTLSYIFILAVLPFFGLLVYYLFGQDYRKSKLFEKKRLMEDERVKKFHERLSLSDAEAREFKEKFGDGNAKIRRLLHHNQQSALTFDNNATVLENGEEKYKRLFEDIHNAEHYIHMEYFSIKDDAFGKKLIDVLCAKANSGVSVRFIYDDVGSDMATESKKKMTGKGVKHFPFMPVLFSNSTGKLNYRNHRKIAIIDGMVAYVGGINLEQKYDNGYDNERFWRDTHLRVEGSAVGALQSAFLLSWQFVSGESIPEDVALFPKPKSPGPSPVSLQIAASGPDSSWANIMEALFCAINAAEERIYITTPYFMPNDSMLTALSTASRSGVDVRVMLPYKSDSWVAQYATDSYIEQGLASGIRFFRYKKGFLHAKTLVVDKDLSTVGTANFDYRSFSINFEINVLIYNEEINATLTKMFERDLGDCDPVDASAWKHRGMGRKLQESFSRLLAPLL